MLEYTRVKRYVTIKTKWSALEELRSNQFLKGVTYRKTAWVEQ